MLALQQIEGLTHALEILHMLGEEVLNLAHNIVSVTQKYVHEMLANSSEDQRQILDDTNAACGIFDMCCHTLPKIGLDNSAAPGESA